MNSILQQSRSRQREWPVALRALRHRNFRLFFTGQMISVIGIWMEPVAASWLVYRLSGSSLLLGTVASVGQIPVFVLAPLGGMVADLYDRRSILMVTQSLIMTCTLILAGLTLAHYLQLWPVILLVALLGVVNAFDIPARAALTMDMVPRQDLVNAIALNASIFNGARVIGPALAGIVVARFGEGWCFLANGLCFLAVLASLLLMTPIQPRPAPQGLPLQNIIEGFRFVIRTAPVRALVLLLGLNSFTGTVCVVLMPLFAGPVLHGGAKGLGLLMGASGVGALCASIILATRKSVSSLGGWIAIACNSFGVALILFSLSHTFWLSAALLVFAGFSVTLVMASSSTLIQNMVPDNLCGRVMAACSMMFMGMVPLGALLAGGLANAIGTPATVAMGGAVAITGGIIFATRLSVLRPRTQELIAVQRASSSAPAQEIIAPVLSSQGEAS